MSQILLILLVVDLFLWLLANLGVPPAASYPAASGWLAWIAAILLTVFIVLPGVR